MLALALLIVAIYCVFVAYVFRSGVWGSLAIDFVLSQGAVVAFSAGTLLILWFLWRSPRGRAIFPPVEAPSRRVRWAGTGYLVLAVAIVAIQVGLGVYWWSQGLDDARGFATNMAASVYMALFLVGVAVVLRGTGQESARPAS